MGAFAAIWLGCYFIAQLALAVTAAQMQADLTALAFGYCISRSLSGLAVASFPLAKTVVWHILLQSTRIKRRCERFSLSWQQSFVSFAVFAAGKRHWRKYCRNRDFLYYRFRLIGKFGGLSGDLAGWFVQMCELFMLAAVVLTEYL